MMMMMMMLHNILEIQTHTFVSAIEEERRTDNGRSFEVVELWEESDRGGDRELKERSKVHAATTDFSPTSSCCVNPDATSFQLRGGREDQIVVDIKRTLPYSIVLTIPCVFCACMIRSSIRTVGRGTRTSLVTSGTLYFTHFCCTMYSCGISGIQDDLRHYR